MTSSNSITARIKSMISGSDEHLHCFSFCFFFVLFFVLFFVFFLGGGAEGSK